MKLCPRHKKNRSPQKVHFIWSLANAQWKWFANWKLSLNVNVMLNVSYDNKIICHKIETNLNLNYMNGYPIITRKPQINHCNAHFIEFHE